MPDTTAYRVQRNMESWRKMKKEEGKQFYRPDWCLILVSPWKLPFYKLFMTGVSILQCSPVGSVHVSNTCLNTTFVTKGLPLLLGVTVLASTSASEQIKMQSRLVAQRMSFSSAHTTRNPFFATERSNQRARESDRNSLWLSLTFSDSVWLSLILSGSLSLSLRICLQSPCLVHKELARLLASLLRYSTLISSDSASCSQDISKSSPYVPKLKEEEDEGDDDDDKKDKDDKNRNIAIIAKRHYLKLKL